MTALLHCVNQPRHQLTRRREPGELKLSLHEAGIADTLGRERTVIIEIGNVQSFSDAVGRHVVGMTAVCASVTRLRNGCGSLARPAIPRENDWFEAASEETLRLRREVKPTRPVDRARFP
jgi:hypothetical protein